MVLSKGVSNVEMDVESHLASGSVYCWELALDPSSPSGPGDSKKFVLDSRCVLD